MAIRITDSPARRGSVAQTLDDVVAAVLGSNAQPSGRSGVVGSQTDGVSSLITGHVVGPSGRTGVIGASLAGVAPTMNGTFAAAGGGGGPAAPASVVAYADGTPGTLYATFAASAGAASYEMLTSTGVTGVQRRFTLSNSSVDALSCRVDGYNAPSVSTTIQIRGVNASGVAGPYSAPSNAVTPAAHTNTWPADGHNMHVVACGGTQVGLSQYWHDGYFNGQFVRYVDPGTPTSGAFATAMNCPAYPPGIGASNQKIAELTPQSNAGFGYLVNILLQNPALNSNGAFNSNPYGRFCGYIFPTVNAQHVIGRTETTINFEGVPSAVAGAVVTYANQTMGANCFVPFSTGQFNRTNGGSSGWSSNTATTITNDNAGGLNAHAGDHILTQVGDQLVAQDVGGIERWIVSPTPGVLTPNVWNRWEVPVGAAGWNLPAYNFGIHYKQNIAFPIGSNGKGAGYIFDMGWVQG